MTKKVGHVLSKKEKVQRKEQDNMRYEDFKDKYAELPAWYRNFLHNVMNRMSHTETHMGLDKGYDFPANVKAARKKRHKTMEQMAEELGADVRTLYKMIQHESVKSIYFNSFLKILNVKKEDMRKPPKDYEKVVEADHKDLQWLYNSLTLNPEAQERDTRNKDAIDYITNEFYNSVMKMEQDDDCIVIKDISGNDPPIIIR